MFVLRRKPLTRLLEERPFRKAVFDTVSIVTGRPREVRRLAPERPKPKEVVRIG